MSETSDNTVGCKGEDELTDLEKSIISDFNQLTEENQLAVINYILTMLN